MTNRRTKSSPNTNIESDRRYTKLAYLTLVVFTLAAAAFAVLQGLHPSRATDLFWQVRTGQLILASGPPHHDIFTWTRFGKEWCVNEWMFFAALALVCRTGIGNIWYLHVALLCLIGATLFLCCALISKCKSLSLCLSAIILTAMSPFLAPRPQMATYILLTSTCAISVLFIQGKASRAHLVGLVPLFAFWANVHQGVVVGVALLLIQALRGIQLQDRAAGKALALTALACLAATLLTPYGIGLYKLIAVTLAQPAAMQVNEWRPHLPSASPSDISFAFLWLVALAGIVISKSKQSLWEAALLAVFVIEGYLHYRNMPISAIIIGIVLWEPIQSVVASLNSQKVPLAVRLALAAGVACILLSSALPPGIYLIGHSQAAIEEECIGYDRFPWEAVHFLDYEKIPGGLRQYNDYPIGGMLGYARPQQLVFLDSRADICDGPLIANVLKIMNPAQMKQPLTPDEVAFVRSYDFDDAIVTAPRLAAYLAGQPDWSLIYVHHIGPVFDTSRANAWIFFRNRPQFAALIARARSDWAAHNHGQMPTTPAS